MCRNAAGHVFVLSLARSFAFNTIVNKQFWICICVVQGAILEVRRKTALQVRKTGVAWAFFVARVSGFLLSALQLCEIPFNGFYIFENPCCRAPRVRKVPLLFPAALVESEHC